MCFTVRRFVPHTLVADSVSKVFEVFSLRCLPHRGDMGCLLVVWGLIALYWAIVPERREAPIFLYELCMK